MSAPTPLLVGDILRASAARTPHRIAVALGDEQRTYAEVARDADHLARVLAAQGVGRGDRLGWWSPTTLDAVPVFFASAYLGAIFTPLNPAYTEIEAAAVLKRADPAVVLTTDGRGGHPTYAEVTDRPSDASIALPEVHETDGHVMYFTSGTTGEPKGVVLSHRIQRLRTGTGSWPQGGNVCMFPQFHMAGWSGSLGCWMSGDPVIYVTRPDADNLMAAVDRHRASTLYCIPAVWQRILNADRSGYDLSSLRRADTGTSATTPELLRAIADTFPGTTTSIAYGSTEAGLVCSLWPQDIHRKPGSVGPPAPGVYVRIDDNGELWARSALLFSEYFRNPEATAEALVDGWYRTGEVAERDDEGYFYIVGRAKEIIRTGGESVSPVEVDLVLQSHPAVADAAVAGVPHDDWGEVIAAFVVLKAGKQLELEELRRFCEDKLARHKQPRQLFVVDAITRTPTTGQVQRRRLVDIAEQISVSAN